MTTEEDSNTMFLMLEECEHESELSTLRHELPRLLTYILSQEFFHLSLVLS